MCASFPLHIKVVSMPTAQQWITLMKMVMGYSGVTLIRRRDCGECVKNHHAQVVVGWGEIETLFNFSIFNPKQILRSFPFFEP